MPKDPNWTCERCRSHHWVQISLDEGASFRAQCVPCGWIGGHPPARNDLAMERERLMAERERLLREGVPIEDLARLVNVGGPNLTGDEAPKVTTAPASEPGVVGKLVSSYGGFGLDVCPKPGCDIGEPHIHPEQRRV